jgi:hypothetical protein
LRTGGAKEVALDEGKPEGRFAGVLKILDTEPGLLYDTRGSKANLSDLVRSMQITIVKGLVGGKEVDLVVNLGTEDLVQPLVGLDDEGVPVANDTFQKLMVYHERGLGNAAVLGRAFLEKVSNPDVLFVPRTTANPKKKALPLCGLRKGRVLPWPPQPRKPLPAWRLVGDVWCG